MWTPHPTAPPRLSDVRPTWPRHQPRNPHPASHSCHASAQTNSPELPPCQPRGWRMPGMARPLAGLQPSMGPRLSSGSPECQSRVRGRQQVRCRWWVSPSRLWPNLFFRGVGSQCPSDMPELDRGVTPNLAMPFWRASAQQRGHAKPGDALLACQRSTGGVAPNLVMNFGGGALHMGVMPSLAMLSGGQRSIGACTKPGNAPLMGQCSTEELR